MSHRTLARTLALSAGLVALATAPASALGATPERLATCDELAGTTANANDRWRLFYDSDEFDTELTACRRAPGPARRVLHFGNFYTAPQLVGNLVELHNSGRYVSQGLAVDLSTLRYIVLYEDDPFDRGSLLPSGAIVSAPTRAAGPGPAAPGVPSPQVADLTIDDAAGTRVVASGQVSPSGTSLITTLAPFGHVGAPTSGFYVTRPDASVQRHISVGPVDTTHWSQKLQASWSPHRERVRRTPGLTVASLPDTTARLETRRARRGHTATLTLRRPSDRSMRKTHLVARLAPGSASDLMTMPGTVIVARFLDRPTERRLRIPDLSRKGSFVLDLPVPADLDRDDSAYGPGGIVAFRDGAAITLAVGSRATGRYEVRSIPTPNGARDLAFAPLTYGVTADQRLIYTDDTGTPVAVTIPGSSL